MLLRVTRIWLLPCCASCPEKESAPGAPERFRETSLPGILSPLSDRPPGLSGGLPDCAPDLPAGLAHCPPACPGHPSCGSLLGSENPFHCPPARPERAPYGSLLGPDRLLHRPLDGLFGPCLTDRLLHDCPCYCLLYCCLLCPRRDGLHRGGRWVGRFHGGWCRVHPA